MFRAVAFSAIRAMALCATSSCYQLSIKHRTYARHEFRTQLIPSARLPAMLYLWAGAHG
jgi:hypothetical protein